MRYILLILLVGLAGCSRPMPTFMWARPDGQMSDLRRDNAVCTNQAYVIAGANPYVYAETAYQNCMIGKGWELKDVVYK